MAQEFDLVVRGGTIVDGRGGTPYVGDIAIKDSQIVGVGRVEGGADREINAAGLLVTPGFVDIHTHYDGHVTWASHLEPSSNHGVTTVVTGNCGVGFAPCRPKDRNTLIALMEGVEDIPGPVLTRGLPWAWESFSEFLDYLDGRKYDIDVAIQIPHAPVRVFAMGERGAAGTPASPAEIEMMRGIVCDAVKAGALGFSTSRSINHRASDGSPTPSLTATEAELTGIALGLRDAGTGVLQAISDFADPAAEFDMLRRTAEASGRPLSISLMQFPHAPDRWRMILDWIGEANDAGTPIKAQVCGRPVGTLVGLDLSFNPFTFCPSYQEIADHPLADRVALLRDPARRERIFAEFPGSSDLPIAPFVTNLENLFVMGPDPVYEPSLTDSVAALAGRAGLAPHILAYDLMLEEEGRTIFYLPTLNYVGGSIAAPEAMLRDPNTVLGLGDGGAHCGIVCDASFTSYMLIRWAPVLGLASVVKSLTADTARAVGLDDRGIIAPGYRADLNLIDRDCLRLHRPEMVDDLPDGGSRLHQRVDGFVATIVRGIITRSDGATTGALPGRLVRGQQPAPEGVAA